MSALDTVLIEPLGAHRDTRGLLFEPLGAGELDAQRNVHVVLTSPGAVRGNHAHRTAIETTTVVGPCLVRLKEPAGMRDVNVPPGAVWRFTIPPGVVHAYRNTGPDPLILVSFSNEPHDAAGVGTWREPILE